MAMGTLQYCFKCCDVWQPNKTFFFFNTTGDILLKHSDASHSHLMNSIIKKSTSYCTDLKSWCPVVDLCKQYNTPIPEELFDILIRKNQWIEFLIACDVFDYADVSFFFVLLSEEY